MRIKEHKRGVIEDQRNGDPEALRIDGGAKKRVEVSRTSLLREVYRSLLNTGRTYAGFRQEDAATVARLAEQGTILDPMSGYGGLASFCSQLGASSFGVEFNPPQYLWQILLLPQNADRMLCAIDQLIQLRRKWPKSRQRAVVSNEFFPSELQRLQSSLFEFILSIVEHTSDHDRSPSEAALALLLPFSGRLCCTSPADISTHTKQGGTCVLLGWQDDFQAYLEALERRLITILRNAKGGQHRVILGDARTIQLDGGPFTAMFTSPPYPNHRDFSTILLPENTLIDKLSSVHGLPILMDRSEIIGSNFVKGTVKTAPSSLVVARFLAELSNVRRDKRAQYDDRVYYVPYFEKYFCALESAYVNVSQYLAPRFEGFVTVVNNTHRGIVIPVAETVREVWETLGFHSEIHRSIEMFHLGTRNPRAKGIRARHTEYVVRIWR